MRAVLIPSEGATAQVVEVEEDGLLAGEVALDVL
jgi:hypothetical protein